MENSNKAQLFIGTYQVKVDDKHRIVLPEELAAMLKECYICLGKDKSLCIMTKKFAEQKMRQLAETLSHFKDENTIRNMAVIREVAKSIIIMISDKPNRYLLPVELLKRVGIRSGDTVCLIGKGDYVELRLRENQSD